MISKTVNGEIPVTILMLDHFKIHLLSSVVNELNKLNTIVMHLPAGTTSKIQVLDVGVNKPYKDCLRLQSNLWLSTKAPNDAINRRIVAEWTMRAWNGISNQCIVDTFAHIGYVIPLAQ